MVVVVAGVAIGEMMVETAEDPEAAGSFDLRQHHARVICVTKHVSSDRRRVSRRAQEQAHKENPGELPGVSAPPSPAPLLMASMRKDVRLQASRDARLCAAYQELVQEGVRPTGDTLSRRAHCNRSVALSWLKGQRTAG